jgi:hypothetical protein
VAEYLRIRNWSKYQDIAGRGAPYVKLHTSILLDMEYMMLPDRERLAFLLLLAFAGVNQNKLPGDAGHIMHLCHLDDPPNIEAMKARGLLEDWTPEAGAQLIEAYEEKLRSQRDRKRKSRASRTGHAQGHTDVTGNSPLETETETETRQEKDMSEPAAPACPHLEIISAYHEVLPERPQVIPARWRGSVSERNLQARWRENAEHRTVDFWRDLFGAVRTNDWWMRGDERGTWKGVDLHWLLKRTNFDKAVQHWANLP